MLIYSFSQHLLRSYSSTGTVLGFRNTNTNKDVVSHLEKPTMRKGGKTSEEVTHTVRSAEAVM